MEARPLVRRAVRGRVAMPVAREQALLFRVGEGLYGIGIRGLWEVLSPEGITSLPTPQYQICAACPAARRPGGASRSGGGAL